MCPVTSRSEYLERNGLVPLMPMKTCMYPPLLVMGTCSSVFWFHAHANQVM